MDLFCIVKQKLYLSFSQNSLFAKFEVKFVVKIHPISSITNFRHNGALYLYGTFTLSDSNSDNVSDYDNIMYQFLYIPTEPIYLSESESEV